jgi:hypothetical protein
MTREITMTIRTNRNRLIGLVFTLALAACGGGEPAETEPAADEAAQADESFAEPLVDSLEKAKAVDQQVQQHKQDIDRALAEAEGETEDDDE